MAVFDIANQKYCYCISYDLKQPNRDYTELISAIQKLGPWWHQTGSVWLVNTSKNVIDIRTEIAKYMDEDDKLFIITVVKPWAGKGFNKEEYEWLKQNVE